MQLFHIDADKIHIKWNNLEVFPIPELISQLRKVLRIQKWDKISIQYSEKDKTTRLELSVIDRTDQKLLTEIISSKYFKLDENNVWMLIAMPNKREKAELIVQKLTEIWVKNIYFWVSEHSIIRQWNDKKAERLDKISREAVEQSRWIQLPEIKFIKSESELKEIVAWKNVILANQGWLPYWKIIKDSDEKLYWVIWPEWGFSEKDLKLFDNAKIVDLWKNVLRMETASIVFWWLLKNNM
jgi:RsmE family RNA methyltransferase